MNNNTYSVLAPTLVSVVLFCLSFVALTRFHTGIAFSSWEIVAHALTFFALLVFGMIAVRIISVPNYVRSTALWILFCVIVVCTVVVPVFGNTLGLQGVQRIGYHDGTAQTDVAFEALMKGQNPYSVNYDDTRFGDMYGRLRVSDEGDTIPNPALTQYIYLPGTLLQGALSAFQRIALGITDARPIMLISMLLATFLLVRLLRRSSVELKILAAALFLLNPVYLRYLLEGANDTFLLFLIVVGVFLLDKKSMRGSGLVLGLALATKHFAWFLLPFLAVYLYTSWKQGGVVGKDLQRLVGYAVVVFGVCVVPFLLWAPTDFVQDTVFYALGSGTAAIFPITGYGFSQVVTLFGIEPGSHFPFLILTLPVTGVLVWLGSRFVFRRRRLSSVLLVTAFTLFGYMFFSRMMNENYMGLVVGLLIVGAVFSLHEQSGKEYDGVQATKSQHV